MRGKVKPPKQFLTADLIDLLKNYLKENMLVTLS